MANPGKASRLTSSRYRLLIALIGVLIALLAWTANRIAPTVEVALVTSAINHDAQHAFTVALPHEDDWLYVIRSDSQDSPNGSRLDLYEDGRSLGPRHAPHDDIRRDGAGRYSHWNGQVWFSASDGSDPRTNGRVYTGQVKKSLRDLWQLVAVVAALTAMIALLWSTVAVVKSLDSDSGLANALRNMSVLVRPAAFGRAPSLTALAVGAAAGGFAVWLGWYSADITTTGLGVARYFPVSDAFGYHSCATSIAASGEFNEPLGAIWCSRRAIYPSMLAGLLWVSGWSSQLALVLQGAVTGAALVAFALVIAVAASPLAAIVATAVLSFYAWEFVLGLYMTEVPGFVLGLTGLTLLVSYCSVARAWLLFAGVGLISVGLVARAGAIAVLPALVVWSALANRELPLKQRAGLVAGATLAAAIGPLLQIALVLAFGADPSDTGGNFSTSLYGLSTGSRDWTQAQRDFAQLFAQAGEKEAFRHIYGVAFANISERPGIFLSSLAGAGHAYVSTLFDFGVLARCAFLMTALAALGIVRALIDIRTPLSRLLLLAGMAEFLVAPLIIDSGWTRVFAATVGLRVLLAAIGAQWLLNLLFGRSNASAVGWSRPGLSCALWAASATSAFLLVLVVLPVTGVGRLMWLDRVPPANQCAKGLTEVVARIGRETQYIVVSDDAERVHSVVPFDVGLGRLRGDSRMTSTWYGKDFLQLTPPITLLRAVDLTSPGTAAVKPFFYRGVLHDELAPQSLCVNYSEFLVVAGMRHFEVRSVRPLPPARAS